ETVSNHTNYMISSNDQNFTRVEISDRRNMCFICDNKYASVQTDESKKYFDALRAVDPRTFAYFLYHRSLSGYNPRKFISTAYTRHQKLINFETPMLFLDNLLRMPDWEAKEHSREELYDNYAAYCSRNGQGLKFKQVMGQASFWHTFRAIFPF